MVSAVSALIPATVTGTIFGVRRVNKGLDNFSDSPVYGLMNFGIAAGQGLKAAKSCIGIAEASEYINKFDNIVADTNFGSHKFILDMNKKAKATVENNKFLRGTGKGIGFISDHINKFIVLAGITKAMSADDKVDALKREAINLGGMFAFEELAKQILGKTTTSKNIFGVSKTINRIALHKRLPEPAKQFIDNAIGKLYKYCNSKNLKWLPPVLNGLFFVTASIAGYEIGECIGNKLLGKQKKQSKRPA